MTRTIEITLVYAEGTCERVWVDALQDYVGNRYVGERYRFLPETFTKYHPVMFQGQRTAMTLKREFRLRVFLDHSDDPAGYIYVEYNAEIVPWESQAS